MIGLFAAATALLFIAGCGQSAEGARNPNAADAATDASETEETVDESVEPDGEETPSETPAAESSTEAAAETETATTSEPGAETEPEAEPAPEPTADPDEPVTAATNDISSGSGCGNPYDVGPTVLEFEFEDRQRTVDLYVPRSYDPDVETPLVLNWHGLGDDGAGQLAFSEYRPLSELHGILVALPTGIPNPGSQLNSWEVTEDADESRDDIAFANEVLDRVIAAACVDETRVYSTGFSNGGFFTSRLICEMADRIAAAAAVGGLTHDDGCTPSRPVPFIAFHGTADDSVPFNGDGESTIPAREQTLRALMDRSIVGEFGEFATDFNCGTASELELSDNVVQFAYADCDDDVQLIFHRVDGAGHTWPGSAFSQALSEELGLGITTDEIRATSVSWDFFSRYTLE